MKKKYLALLLLPALLVGCGKKDTDQKKVKTTEEINMTESNEAVDTEDDKDNREADIDTKEEDDMSIINENENKTENEASEDVKDSDNK